MRILPWLIVVLLSASAWADVVVLKDGTRLEGSIKKVDDQWQITGLDGKVTLVPAGSVQSIQLGSGRSDAAGGASAAALASLRRSVEAVSDINQIIERYERLIAGSTDAAVTAEAEKELATWRQRRDRGMIKQGAHWVTPEEAVQLRTQAISTAASAREQLRQGRLADAEVLLQQALDQDPSNPAGLYLRGVLLYRQDKLVDARKAFEAVDGQVSGHAPTLNNLAVILWRQNQQGAALSYYDQAMLAAPVNKFVLDNVADSLGTMPDDHRRGKAAERVVRRFTEQDTLLQQQLSAQGWFRWGSTWVDQKQLDELKAAEREIRARLAELEQEFESNKLRIAQIDDHIRANEQQIRSLEARSVWRDPDGRVVRMPLPNAYYDLKRENDNLRSEQERLRVRFEQLREIARRTQQQLPTPRFAGVQQIVGIEGTPLLPPLTAPLTPATSPVGG
jgi:tetratricopeptide (TPR) repeat protein